MNDPNTRRGFLASLASMSALAACSSNAGVSVPPVARPTGSGTPTPSPTGSGAPTATPTGSPKPTTSPTVAPSATPTVVPTPTPTPPIPLPTGVAGTLPLTIVNKNPNFTGTIYVYVYGQVATGGNAGVWVYSTQNGTTATANAGFAIPPITIPASTSANATIYLPGNITGGRIYIGAAPLTQNGYASLTFVSSTGGVNAPAPWAADTFLQSVYFEFAEFASPPGNFDCDTSQVDAMSIPLQLTLVGGQHGTQNTGFLSGAVTQVASRLNALGSPWSVCAAQMPYRLTNPQHCVGSGVVNPFPTLNFLDAAILAVWQAYQTTFVTLTNSALGAGPWYGQVDANNNMNFYLSPSTSGALVATIPSPFTSQPYVAAGGWISATAQMLACNGAFITPTAVGSYSFPQNANQTLAQGLGNIIVSALNRGVFGTSSSPIAAQPVCTGAYPGTPYQSQWANVVHAVAANGTYGYNQAYAFSYDDQCGASTNIADNSATSMTITIWPT